MINKDAGLLKSEMATNEILGQNLLEYRFAHVSSHTKGPGINSAHAATI
jgi:hypothetical protein